MKKLLLLVLLVFVFTLPSYAATFSLVQIVNGATCVQTSQTCLITAAATGAGHTLAIAVTTSVGSDFVTAVSAGGTYTFPVACQATDTVVGKSSSFAYTLNATGGVTSITVTRTTTTSGVWRAVLLELSDTGTISFDTCGSKDSTSASTAPTGPNITLAGTNDAVYQMVSSASVTAVSPACFQGANAVFSSVIGAAVCLNTNSGTGPTWTTANARAALSAIAFQDSGGGGGGTPVVPWIATNSPRNLVTNSILYSQSTRSTTRETASVSSKFTTSWSHELQALEPRKERMGIRRS